ncbi:prefoldin subunit alpha [Candidatus Pacearchaeota archaeon]|nr:prefoldin subunit alpha [Candidatus Pacearchaeota archaeon]
MENQQELMFKLSMYEQQIQQLQQQLQAIEQGIVEMKSLNLGLDELNGAEGKEVMAPIGRGIFAKTKLLSENLVVDIGGGNLVKKSIADTKKIIDEQVKKLEDIKEEMNINLEKLSGELMKMIGEAEKKEKN